MTICFVDCETTGLHAGRHPIWEIGLIDANGIEHRWLLPITDDQYQAADPLALQIGGFHERHPRGNAWRPTKGAQSLPRDWCHSREEALKAVLDLTNGAHLAGAVVSFDEERLALETVRLGLHPSWHYHIVDVEALAAGYLARRGGNATLPADIEIATPPWDSNALSLAVGVDPKDFERHTALGDCRWAKAIYEAVMG